MRTHSDENYEKLVSAFKHNQWVAANGNVTSLMDMDNMHLYNTIEMLRRSIRDNHYTGRILKLMIAWLFRLQAEANMRGQLGREY